jgi:quercetin dioxygenase-like cupin family protein
VPPHWHPTDEGVTILSGTLRAGMGEKMDEGSMKDLATGSYVLMPRNSPHYVKAKGETVVQIHGAGPLEFMYVNPQDDPRKKKTTE